MGNNKRVNSSEVNNHELDDLVNISVLLEAIVTCTISQQLSRVVSCRVHMLHMGYITRDRH